MKTRELGRSGLKVSAMGFGCMGINFSYAHKLSLDEGVALIRAAVERGALSPTDTIESRLAADANAKSAAVRDSGGNADAAGRARRHAQAGEAGRQSVLRF